MRHTALAALALCLAGCCCGLGGDEMPEEFLGVWGSADARYKGRLLVITRDEVRFGSVAAHPILGVERQDSKNLMRVAITYANESDQSYTLRIEFNRPRGTIQFANQTKVVWKLLSRNAAGTDLAG